MSSMRKDNTGYDLKQLLIGAEGTLGVVTKVALQLAPMPRFTQLLFLRAPCLYSYPVLYTLYTTMYSILMQYSSVILYLIALFNINFTFLAWLSVADQT